MAVQLARPRVEEGSKSPACVRSRRKSIANAGVGVAPQKGPHKHHARLDSRVTPASRVLLSGWRCSDVSVASRLVLLAVGRNALERLPGLVGLSPVERSPDRRGVGIPSSKSVVVPSNTHLKIGARAGTCRAHEQASPRSGGTGSRLASPGTARWLERGTSDCNGMRSIHPRVAIVVAGGRRLPWVALPPRRTMTDQCTA